MKTWCRLTMGVVERISGMRNEGMTMMAYYNIAKGHVPPPPGTELMDQPLGIVGRHTGGYMAACHFVLVRGRAPSPIHRPSFTTLMGK